MFPIFFMVQSRRISAVPLYKVIRYASSSCHTSTFPWFYWDMQNPWSKVMFLSPLAVFHRQISSSSFYQPTGVFCFWRLWMYILISKLKEKDIKLGDEDSKQCLYCIYTFTIEHYMHWSVIQSGSPCSHFSFQNIAYLIEESKKEHLSLNMSHQRWIIIQLNYA